MGKANLVAVVVLALAAACSSGNDDNASTTTAATATSSTTATTAVEKATSTTTPEGFEVIDIVAGDQHACGLTEDGKAWCWGYNRFGQLGDGTNDDSNVPVAVDTDETFRGLVAGRYFTCGLTRSATTLCWGDNSRGQLGNGETGDAGSDADQNAPVEVSGGLEFTSIVAGQLHSCGLIDTGEAYCWGAYASGQLGGAHTEDQPVPAPAAAELTFEALALGGDTHTCGITTEGPTYCWGDNTFGELGNGAKSNAAQPEPTQVAGGHEFATVALGRTHSCGIDSDGTLWCWGANDMGQLGDDTTDEALEPTQVSSDLTFSSVTANDGDTCGLTADDEAYCWGNNAMGQLGNGEQGDNVTMPMPVDFDRGFTSLTAGEEFTCGVAQGGGAYCWGSNRVGWLGTGSDEASLVPAPVASP
jgi:alpha-tubulin suppressor-like RCC1 family protein